MNLNAENVKNTVLSALFNLPRKTEAELREFIYGIARLFPPVLSDQEIEEVAKAIEFQQGIKVGLGAVIDDEGFIPWLDEEKSSIDPYYWNRYKNFLLQIGLPKDVVIDTDIVTDKILGRLGNPNKNVPWDRRGMVVGHVQSGKTANYTGLICKAADAGYRLIIVIAGIHNNLRNQTQARIDEGFIGRDTGKTQSNKSGPSKHIIGVGKFDSHKTPVSLTNTLRDFNKSTASTNTSEIGSYKVPVVLVIKKNHRTLESLLEWLGDNSAKGDRAMIDQPMLLIDDEADNASINTKYGKKLVTKINGQIRDLLNLFHRSCYVGYTATPFANIFIDPDQDHEMFSEDLFPKDFIIGLGAPTNYFGPSKIFIDGISEDKATWIRYIHDNEPVLPINHKIEHPLNELPDSLKYALRTFLLSRVIRNIRGQKSSHCSMLVNASRFTAVQSKLRHRLHDELEKIINAVRVHASLGKKAIDNYEVAALKDVWECEYKECYSDWSIIQSSIFDAIASAKVVEVNSKENNLKYAETSDRGQTVIAVGGFSLSRGLTLEGLTVTWFLRNTMMYDTLMQMGRWFGYRTNYEDLCRIWMPKKAVTWYSYIANATEELHEELRLMEEANATPKQFGLAVRSHPASLLITARNKLGSGKKITALIGLSNKFVETTKVSLEDSDLANNFAIGKTLVDKLLPYRGSESRWGTLFKDVSVHLVDNFLIKWRNHDDSKTTDPSALRSYIRARQHDELKTWDVLVTSLQNGVPNNSLGLDVIPINRFVDLEKLESNCASFSGSGMRVASRGIEKAGVDEARALDAEREYREHESKSDNETINYPDRIYRRVRDKALFILYLVQAKPPAGQENDVRVSLIPKDPIIAWGISLPVSSRPQEKVEYVVNTKKYQELFGFEDEDEDSGDDSEN